VRLFDTFFVYENYPIDAAKLSGGDGLAVAAFAHHESNHYPLAVQALPGSELGLRVEFDTDVFDASGIQTLIERFNRVLVAMTTDPTYQPAADRYESFPYRRVGRSGPDFYGKREVRIFRHAHQRLPRPLSGAGTAALVNAPAWGADQYVPAIRGSPDP